MIDINCHILPGLDIGPNTLAESIAMAKIAARQGVNKIVATPYFHYRMTLNSPEAIIAAVDYINEKIRGEGIPVNILPGQKIILNPDIIDDLERGMVLPINKTTQYITIEIPKDQIPYNLQQIIYEIQLNGYIPVIVSPEIHDGIHENPNILYSLVKNGALCSISPGSIVGTSGKKVQKLTEKLLQADLIHLIGSNANSKQGGYMSGVVPYFNKHYPGLLYQFSHNSDALIRGESILKNEPSRIMTKKWSVFGK